MEFSFFFILCSRHVFYLKHDVSETGIGVRLKTQLIQLYPNDRVSVSAVGTT
jgi:hypothetical protein